MVPNNGKSKRAKVEVLTSALFLVALGALCFAVAPRSVESQVAASPRLTIPASQIEYLWYEAENMRGITQNARHEPLLNPSYLELPASKVPGWAISGPGVSAEWS